MVTHSPPTSEVGGSEPGTYAEKLVVADRWSAVYGTQPYVLLSSAQKTTRHDMTCSVESNIKPKSNN